MPWDDDLRDQQKAVAGSARGDAVVLAGPGTGKTLVLVRRVEYLIEVHEVRPRAISALTFTRAAAAEMRERLERRLGRSGAKVRVSTLHSYALRELLKAGAAGLPSGPLRIAGDWEERWVVVEELARILDRNVPDIRNQKDGALDRLADDWDTLRADDEGWEEGYPDPQFLSAWRRHREVYGYTLRSELVYQLLCELRSNADFIPSAGTEMFLVDEYQDLNRCDLDTIAMLAARAGAEVFAAGDDDQSIYSFRHAHPQGIRGFKDEYAAAVEHVMTECLRCGPAVVELANWLIAQELKRREKTLTSITPWAAEVHLLRFKNQKEEAKAVAQLVLNEVPATPAEEVLILLKSDRYGRMSRALTETLEKSKLAVYLPRQAAELDAAVQALLEYLILTAAMVKGHVDDLALRSLLELLPNGIGEMRLRAVMEYCFDEGMRFWQGLQYLREHPDAYQSSGIDAIGAEADRILEEAREFVQKDGETLQRWIERLCDALKITEEEALENILRAAAAVNAELEELGEDPDARVSYIDLMLAALNQLGDTLPARIPGRVTITTMHGAKGLSADIVIVLQVEDEMIPGAAKGAAYDEARRLLYVSLTRARKKLFIGACEGRTRDQAYAGGKVAAVRNLSQFIADYGLQATTVPAYIKANTSKP